MTATWGGPRRPPDPLSGAHGSSRRRTSRSGPRGVTVGPGLRLGSADPVGSPSASRSHLFIRGLVLTHLLALSSAGRCKLEEVASRYQHCGLHPDGVRDLDCFGRSNEIPRTCVWKTGNPRSDKTYTLIIQQKEKKYCQLYPNITETSKTVSLFENSNMTAEVVEHSGSSNCTKAVFRASAKSLSRCYPPVTASFSRQSGKLDVNVSWHRVEMKAAVYFSVRYKALSSQWWKEPLVQSKKSTTCTVEDLDPSLAYVVQIQCVTNNKCQQCLWSETYTVPSELTSRPVIVNLEETDVVGKKGRRLLVVNWKFPGTEPYDGFRVTLCKASGEAPCERTDTARPEIRLILSHSAYNLRIVAVNNASTSPALSQTIPQREGLPGDADGKLNVTVHSSTSFTIHWWDDLVRTHVCYSAEWQRKGHGVTHMSFFQNEHNYRTLSPLPEPLEPYKRYNITLHTRPNKETCNIKYINNSESTYGTSQFYLTEGAPISAPNISCNGMLNSVVLRWLSIPEEDVRGFLKGYKIYHAEYHRPETERNITVDPNLDTYELEGLTSGKFHQVQISGYTQAGVGVRSTVCIFRLNQGYRDLNKVVSMSLFAVVAIVLIFGAPIIKRAKVILWPSIPNPGKSNAMQKIEGPCEMELLESINTLMVEEQDTNSLQVVKKEAVALPSALALALPLLHGPEDEGGSLEMTCGWIRWDMENAGRDAADASSNANQTDAQSSPLAFSSDYTTIEMLQQMMPEGDRGSVADVQAAGSERPHFQVMTAIGIT